MLKVISATIITLLLTVCVPAIAQTARDPYAFAAVSDTSRWTLLNVDAEPVDTAGRPALHLVSHGDSANGIIGLALPKGEVLRTGVVELDLKGKSLRGNSFLGIAFNVTDARQFEAIYFRPFNFNVDPPFRDRAVQYISWPANTWEVLRKGRPGQFEARVANVPDADDWFHARIEIKAREVRVFVNGAGEPSLVVERLATGDVPRPVGLFVDTADGFYANLRISRDD